MSIEDVQCVVCLTVTMPPWQGCPECGHLICRECYAQLGEYPNKCPSCRTTFRALARAIVAEKLAEVLNVAVECPNGCETTVLFKELEAHRRECRPVECLVCDFRGTPRRVMEHLVQRHDAFQVSSLEDGLMIPDTIKGATIKYTGLTDDGEGVWYFFAKHQEEVLACQFSVSYFRKKPRTYAVSFKSREIYHLKIAGKFNNAMIKVHFYLYPTPLAPVKVPVVHIRLADEQEHSAPLLKRLAPEQGHVQVRAAKKQRVGLE